MLQSILLLGAHTYCVSQPQYTMLSRNWITLTRKLSGCRNLIGQLVGSKINSGELPVWIDNNSNSCGLYIHTSTTTTTTTVLLCDGDCCQIANDNCLDTNSMGLFVKIQVHTFGFLVYQIRQWILYYALLYHPMYVLKVFCIMKPCYYSFWFGWY